MDTKAKLSKHVGDEGYYAPYEVLSPAKHKPSAPLGDVHVSTTEPIKRSEAVAHVPLADPIPPSAMLKRGFLCLTLKLIPYHLLNFALGTGAFCVVVTGVSLAGGLLPLCGLGIVVYIVLLHCVRWMAVMDVMLANSITRSQAAIVWNVPDHLETDQPTSHQIRIAPKLAKLSWRSTGAILYFASVKFGLGIVSCVVVCLPFLPIASEIVAHTANTEDTYVAGWSVHAFNLSTHPVLYLLASIGYFIVGIFLMHFFGQVSRETTRRVLCKEIIPTARHLSV